MVVLSDEGDRLTSRHAVEDRNARERRARPAASFLAGDLDAFSLRAPPSLAERVPSITAICG
jgi:hypothetical protein